ncbi:hypothetical protein D3C81_404300 [compost metagenome]
MGVVARFKKSELLMTGEIQERSPSIKNGLVNWFPFDGTLIGSQRKNIIDPTDIWKVGVSGTQGKYWRNGTAEENTVIMFKNPWGYEEPVWASLSNDAASDNDGGYNVNDQPIDPTKKYRFSVWLRRENIGDGTTHFGPQGNYVSSLGSSTANTNPYFSVNGPGTTPVINNWALFVAYVHPASYSTTTSDPTNGIYDLTGKRLSPLTDFKWMSNATLGGVRSYLFYSTSINERAYWCRPRMEICDGSESTIQDLILGMDDNSYITSQSNTTILNNGVAVQNPTTNLAAAVPYGVYAYATNNGTLFMNNPHNRNYVNKYTVTSTAGAARGQKMLPAVQGTTYAMSIVMKKKSNNGVLIVSPSKPSPEVNNTISVQTVNTRTEDLGMGWFKVIELYTITSNTTSSCIFNFGIAGGAIGDEFYVYDLQWEDKIFDTEYTDSSRSANGQLDIPLNLYSNFTIGFKFKPDISWGRVFKTSYAQRIFNLYDKNTGKKIWLEDYHSGGTRFNSSPWIGFDEFITNVVPNWHWHYEGTDWDKNKEYWFILTKNGSTWTKYFTDAVKPGYLTQSISITDTALSAFSPSTLSFVGNFSATFSNVMSYNRAITEAEAKIIMTRTLSVDSTGNMYNEVSEFNRLPANSIYFPLDSDTYDIYKNISASDETSVEYVDSSTFVGTASGNQVPNPSGSSIMTGYTIPGVYKPGWDNSLHDDAIVVNNWSSGYNGGVSLPATGYHAKWVYEGIGDKNPCIKFIDQNSKINQPYRWLGVNNPLGSPASLSWTVGTIVNISWSQKVSVSGKYPRIGIYHKTFSSPSMNFVDAMASFPSYTPYVWERKSFNVTITSDWDLSIGCSLYVYGDGPMEGITWVDDVQIEVKQFSTPFMSNSRPQSSLEYNLNRDYGLQWNTEWSIVYWKKPVGTAVSNLTGYNLESLGCNNNSVGGGYKFWGKELNANNLSGPTAFDPANYFNKWHMVSLVHSGNNLTIKFWGINETVATYVSSLSAAQAGNYYVTQYGYDLKLGGYDNGNSPNTYYRDLIVTKRAFTDAELTSLFGNKFNYTNNKLKINGVFKEKMKL